MTSSDFRLERSLELSPDTKAVAETELREAPERGREAIERLRELLKENKDLFYGDDDELLTIFLRPCKWYPESALALVSNFFYINNIFVSLRSLFFPPSPRRSCLLRKYVQTLRLRWFQQKS